MKKLLALVLFIALICCTFTACDDMLGKIWPDKANDPIALIEKADSALENAPFIVNTKVSVDSSNSDIKRILSRLNIEQPMVVDGDNISMEMSTKVSGYTANAKIIIVDKVLYYELSLAGQTARVKAALSDEQYDDFMGNNKVDATMGLDDFEVINLSNVSGGKRIYCNKIKDSGKEKVEEMIGDVSENATLTDVTCTMIVNDDGKYRTANMVCTYSVTDSDKEYTITIKVVTDYSYDDVSEITAPANANKYQEVDADDLL